MSISPHDRARMAGLAKDMRFEALEILLSIPDGALRQYAEATWFAALREALDDLDLMLEALE